MSPLVGEDIIIKIIRPNAKWSPHWNGEDHYNQKEYNMGPLEKGGPIIIRPNTR